MCGIFGIAAHRATVSPALLRQATDSLAHRGPDDSGCTILRVETPEAAEIGLGHRRLAILDLSPAGHQPMHDPRTGNWIVFNGEIYNFRDIRHELESRGVIFQSRSDTEVLLKAYGQWGPECLNRLRGIFAFAIWDASAGELFVARDPMGVKPLFYSEQGAHFIFSSEVRTLLGSGLVPRRLDRDGLVSFLTFGSVYEPHTAVDGVFALPAGHSLRWSAGKIKIRRYWDPPVAAPDSRTPGNEEQVAAQVEESIRLQTVSDVPVGVFLSGGIDSSAITAVLSRTQRPVTFSIVFREKDYSEADASRAVAQRLRTEHNEILCRAEEALTLSRDAVAAMDQPTIDGLNTFLISRVARQAGIKVVLSGLGGDELFCGYRSFRSVPRMERFLRLWNRVPGPTALSGLARWSEGSDAYRKLHALATENGHLVHPYFLARALFLPAQVRKLLRAGAAQKTQLFLREALAETREMDPINRVSWLESRCYMLNTLLRDADVMSMAHGLELRVPLLDDRLATKLLSIRGAHKVHRSTPKILLVQAVRSELPPEIIFRKKQGFTFPFERWLRNDMRAEVEEGLRRIQDGPLRNAIHPEMAAHVWSDFCGGRTSWSRPWALHVLRRWCERNQVSAA